MALRRLSYFLSLFPTSVGNPFDIGKTLSRIDWADKDKLTRMIDNKLLHERSHLIQEQLPSIRGLDHVAVRQVPKDVGPDLHKGKFLCRIHQLNGRKIRLDRGQLGLKR